MNRTVPPRRFILEAIDPLTECPAIEVGFEVNDLADLRTIVDPHANDQDFAAGYDLSQEEVEQIKRQFKIDFDPGDFPVTLRSSTNIDELPYKVHTNRELAMMLRGSKPLAYFYESYPESPHYKIPEHLFDPYVLDGRFLKREYVVRSNHPSMLNDKIRGTRVVLYALKSEEWRLEAFILLQETAEKVGWNEGFERMMGSLLGYEEWQNDIFIEHAKRWRDAAKK